MTEQFHRKPLSNFFIKRSLQIRLIIKIVVAVLIATATFAATILIMYHFKYANMPFYQIDLLKTEIYDRLNIVSIILPSLIVSSIVNIILAFLVGLYASRKYAVPIYKLEQWARMIRQGKISAQIRFREREEMKELSDDCNELTSGLRLKFCEIKKQALALKEKVKDSEELKKIEDVLATLELEGELIEIHTTHFKLPEELKPPKK
jgi:methyl-accepting chemotaxis protein